MIPDLYIAAIITSMLSIAVIGGLLFIRTPQEDRGLLGLLVVVMLPMNALAFFCVRIPLDNWLTGLLGKQSELYQLIRTLYAPITEELAKLWPLLIPLLFIRMKRIPVHRVALAIGLGFGVGEAWTVASLLAKSPEIANYHWYMLGGYMTERMMVCVMHAAFTASALVLMLKYKRILLGLLVCMLLHFLGNFPIFLAGKNAFGLGHQAWQIMLQLWVFAYFLLMGSFLAFLTFGNQWFRKLVRGRAICPECKKAYQHPIFGVNLLHKRYERCPHCKNWHLVSAFDEEGNKANNPSHHTTESRAEAQLPASGER